MRLPDFIGIGPGRSGTTWLYRRLRDHPSVCLARGSKEVNFFNRYYDRGRGWYGSLFDSCGSELVAGEISNLYIYDSSVPERVRETLPGAKILVTLRDPYERLCSVYRYWKGREKLARSTSLIDVVRSPSHPIVRINCYGSLLKRWFELFPDERIHVALFDRLQSDPDRYLSEVAEFLDVKDDWGDSETESGANRAIQGRFPGFGRLARTTAEFLRRSGMRGLLDRLKRSSTVRRLLFTEPATSSREMLTDEVVDALRPVLNPEIQLATETTGLDLSGWKR